MIKKMTNDEKFRRQYGPYKLKNGAWDLTRCFHPMGPGFLGVYGMYEYGAKVKRNIAAFQVESKENISGVIVFPAAALIDTENCAAIIKDYIQRNQTNDVSFTFGHSFKGKFSYEDKNSKEISFNERSVSIEIIGADNETLEGITFTLAHNSAQPVLFKDFKAGSIHIITI